MPTSGSTPAPPTSALSRLLESIGVPSSFDASVETTGSEDTFDDGSTGGATSAAATVRLGNISAAVRSAAMTFLIDFIN